MEPDSDVEIVLIQERDPALYPDARDTTLTEDTIVLTSSDSESETSLCPIYMAIKGEEISEEIAQKPLPLTTMIHANNSSDEDDLIMIDQQSIKKELPTHVSEEELLQLQLGQHIPIFECSGRSYRAVEILDMLICGVPDAKLCTKKPTGVRVSASFIVDLNSVQLRDVAADDNGVWITSNPRRSYSVEVSCGHVIAASYITDGEYTDDTYTLCRQYGTHKNTPDFRRLIATVKDKSGHILPRLLLQYYFKSGVTSEVIISPHGNSLSNKPFYRTQPSTIKEIQEGCTSQSAPVVYDAVFEKAGGLEHSHTASAEPRNKMQIYNAKKGKTLPSGHNKDDLYDLLVLLKHHQADPSGFLKEVTLSSTPSALLATQQQLENLVRFCCQSAQYSVMGVDATFNLGDFYVTIITYQNLLLRNPHTSQPPVFIGPAFIHMERREQDYHTFFSGLLRLEPKLQGLQFYGTDGEQALLNALHMCFPNATGLRCFIHFQDNIEMKLKVASAAMKKAIIRDIFGYQMGDVYHKGLVDCNCSSEFDEKLVQLQEKWESFVPGFHKWFTCTHSVTIKESMLASIRTRAMLGSPPRKYTNNGNESVNSTIKSWVEFKKSSWPQFVEKLQQLVEMQLKEAGKAVYRSGEYILAPEFRKFGIDQTSWHQMQASQRMRYLKKVSDSFPITAIASSKEISLTCEPSMPSLNISLPTLSSTATAQMCEKATVLLKTEGNIVPAPGHKQAYMVASNPSEKPYFVKKGKGDKIFCDPNCAVWRSSRICSHTVAVAVKLDCLHAFVAALQKEPKESNLMNLMTSSKEKQAAGTKSGGKRTRKGSTSRKRVSITSQVDLPTITKERPTTTSASAMVSKGSVGASPSVSSSACNVTVNSPVYGYGSNSNWSSPSWTSSPWFNHSLPPFPYPPPPLNSEQSSIATPSTNTSAAVGSLDMNSPVYGYGSNCNWASPSWSFSPWNNYVPPVPPSYSSTSTPLATTDPRHSHWQDVPPVLSSYGSTSTGTPDSRHSHQQKMSEERPFIVKIINNRIKKCRGCGGDFVRKADGSLPDPPMNLVICHEETRPFRDATNVVRQSKLQNVYYHANVQCIRRQNASFVGPEIVVQDIHLTTIHKQYLKEYFQWNETC